jgi:hypothetical protein
LKVKGYIFDALIFLVLLMVIHVLHVLLFKPTVTLYAALFDCIIASLSTAIFARRDKRLTATRKLFFVVLLQAGIILAILGPTVIDRSLSLYLLTKISESGGKVELAGFNELFISGYIEDFDVIEVRLTEQLKSGTLIVVEDHIQLTKIGRAVVYLASIYNNLKR